MLRERSSISFLADAMLGNIARKLRIFGFDTIYLAHARDDEILKIGIEQDRVILTADKELFKRIVKVGARGVLVSGGASELEDLIHILTKNGITSVGTSGIGFAPYVTGHWRKGHQIRSKMIMVVMIMLLLMYLTRLYHAINNFSNVQNAARYTGKEVISRASDLLPKPRRQAC